MQDIRATSRSYLLFSDFDQTLSFHDSGKVLSGILGVHGFQDRVDGLSNIHLVQQGGELAYLLLHDPEFRKARKEHLIEAGKSPGSPQMNSFGPNMTLARDLIVKGDRETVLQYFELCRKFWKMDYGKLNQWTQDVKAGRTPAFGANLVY